MPKPIVFLVGFALLCLIPTARSQTSGGVPPMRGALEAAAGGRLDAVMDGTHSGGLVSVDERKDGLDRPSASAEGSTVKVPPIVVKPGSERVSPANSGGTALPGGTVGLGFLLLGGLLAALGAPILGVVSGLIGIGVLVGDLVG